MNAEIRKALAEALAKVEYEPGDHPVVPVKHAQFVKDVRAVLDALPEAGAVDDVQGLREAAKAVLSYREGNLPSKGWLRDNDESRRALEALERALAKPVSEAVPVAIKPLVKQLCDLHATFLSLLANKQHVHVFNDADLEGFPTIALDAATALDRSCLATPSVSAPPGKPWRVGRRVPIHVYEGDRPLGTFLTPEDAARAVAAVNAAPQPQPGDGR